MKPLLVFGILFACACTALSQETTNVFADLEAKIRKQLSSDTWHPASRSFILAQWADYKKAHEQPNEHGDFYGANCYGGIQCSCEIDDIREYADAYNYQNLTNRADCPGPHLQIIVSPDNRVFVILEGRRIPAVVNNKIVFFTDGTCVKQNAQFSAKPYAQLEMTMIYKAKHFGWVMGPPASFVDEMSRLVSVKGESGPERNVRQVSPEVAPNAGGTKMRPLGSRFMVDEHGKTATPALNANAQSVSEIG